MGAGGRDGGREGGGEKDSALKRYEPHALQTHVHQHIRTDTRTHAHCLLGKSLSRHLFEFITLRTQTHTYIYLNTRTYA